MGAIALAVAVTPLTVTSVAAMRRYGPAGRSSVSSAEPGVSANDSATLCDSPKASDLGLHRALLHNGQMGFLETFRPYALPEAEWVEEAGRALAGKSALTGGPEAKTD